MAAALTYALYGAGLGGMVGLMKMAKDKFLPPSAPTRTDSEFQQHPHIALDPVVVEALQRFRAYQRLCPREYDALVDNLNLLIGLQVTINGGHIESYYAYRATTYATNIKMALTRAKSRVRNVSVPHWDVDEASVLQIADDYLYNITQDVNQHMMSSRSVP